MIGRPNLPREDSKCPALSFKGHSEKKVQCDLKLFEWLFQHGRNS